jgi:hypothetical protein
MAAVIAGQRIEGTTKSGRSRTVSIDLGTVQVLRDHRKREFVDRLTVGQQSGRVPRTAAKINKVPRAEQPRAEFCPQGQVLVGPLIAARPSPRRSLTVRSGRHTIRGCSPGADHRAADWWLIVR